MICGYHYFRKYPCRDSWNIINPTFCSFTVYLRYQFNWHFCCAARWFPVLGFQTMWVMCFFVGFVGSIAGWILRLRIQTWCFCWGLSWTSWTSVWSGRSMTRDRTSGVIFFLRSGWTVELAEKTDMGGERGRKCRGFIRNGLWVNFVRFEKSMPRAPWISRSTKRENRFSNWFRRLMFIPRGSDSLLTIQSIHFQVRTNLSQGFSGELSKVTKEYL